MAGGRRKRADSSSTVATITDNDITYLHEKDALKALPPRVKTNPDEWPCFMLTDATVYRARDASVANLLHADLEGPFVVRGRLKLDPDQRQHLRNTKSPNPWIQIQSCKNYSVGLNEVNMPVVWAEGERSWYEIEPSSAYSSTAKQMFHAIALQFAIVDEYEEGLEKFKNHRKKANRSKTMRDVDIPLETLLFRCALSMGDGTTLEEAQALCLDDASAIFFLSHLDPQIGFHKWLSAQKPEVAQRLKEKDRIQNADQPIHPMLRAQSRSTITPDVKLPQHPASRVTSKATRQGDRSSNEIESSRAARSKRRSPNTVMQNSPEVKEEPAVPVASIPAAAQPDEEPGLPVLLGVLETCRQIKKDPDRMTPKNYATQLYFQCRVKNNLGGTEILEHYARDLSKSLGPQWHTSDLYEWARKNASCKPDWKYSTLEEAQNLIRRKKKQVAPQQKQNLGSINKESRSTHAGKVAAEARKPIGKSPVRKAGLRPSLGGKKRPFDDFDDEDDMDVDDMVAASKKARLPVEEAHDGDSSASDDEDEVHSHDGTLTRLAIRSHDLPSTKPSGPNQTWTCEEPGCGHVVRAADEPEGQDKINAHYEEHEQLAIDEAQKRVNLAFQEAGKHTPIDHLLEKLRSMGERAQRSEDPHLRTADSAEGDHSGGPSVPQPIKRSLLI